MRKMEKTLFGFAGQKEKQRIARMEAELPLALRTIGMMLDMKVPFAQALEAASRDGELGSEISKALREAEGGAGIPRALASFAERTGSGKLKKAAAQLISAHEQGSRGSELRRMAQDLISMQRYEMRDFVSKSALFGLLFVIFAAVIPTFFLVFATAGKFALGTDVDPPAFLLAFLILFPAIDALILLVSASQMPAGIFSAREEFGKAAGFALLAIGLAVVMLLDAGIVARAAGVVLVSGLSWLLFRKDYEQEARVEKLEDALPDALLGVSGLPKNYGIAKILAKLAEGSGPLAQEARMAVRQLSSGIGAEKALADLAGRNSSFMLRRMARLMLEASLAGANVSEKMHEMAEDLLMLGELRRERENALSTQKYTLLLGSLVVPLILAASLSLVSQLSAFTGELATGAGVLEAAPGAIAAYVVIYSALSALYISHSEGRLSRAVPYFAAMAGAGLIGFYILAQQFA